MELLNTYKPLFEETFGTLNAERLGEIVYSICSDYPQIKRELLLEHVPLESGPLRALFLEGLAQESDPAMLTSRQGLAVYRLCTALTARAYRLLMQEWDILGAAAIHAMVVTAIEDFRCRIKDESGYLELAVDESFEQLDSLTRQIEPDEQETREKFIDLCLDAAVANPHNPPYEDRWRKLMDQVSTGTP